MTVNLESQQGSTRITSIQLGSSWPEFAGEGDRAFLLSYLNDRFGIPGDVFDGYFLFKKKRTFWLVNRSPLISKVAHLKIKRLGIKAFQQVGSFIKPTTRLVQYFGHLATRAVFDIDENQLEDLLKGEYLPMEEDLENGYVILSLMGQVLGLGLLINGKVRSQLPSYDVRYLTTKIK